MKIKYVITIHCIILSIIANNVFAQNIKEIDGIVKMTYAKDTFYNRYWLKEKEFNGKYFIEDIKDIAVEIAFFCDKLNVINIKPRLSFYNIPQFMIQDTSYNDPYLHYGGDIYLDTLNNIIIAFKLKASVLELKNGVCPELKLGNYYKCPIETKPIVFPIYIIVNVLYTSSFNKKEIEENNLIPYSKNYFPVGFCD